MNAVEEFWQREGGQGDFEFLFSELRRFFDLTSITNSPLAMLSKRLDDLWHSFICLTESYSRYCEDHYGYFIHHRALTEETPVPAESIRTFVNLYQKEFGVVPSVWFEGVDEQVISYALGRAEHLPDGYRWSGWPGRGAI